MITLNAGELSKALSFIGQAYKSKTTMPIMQNVKIETDDNIATLTYTNGEQELTYKLPTASKESESFTVELKKLRDRVSQYDKDSDVKIKFDEVKLKAAVSCGRSKITINGLPSSEYPDSQSVIDFTDVNFDGAELKHALATVKMAQGQNDVRSYLNGVLIDFADSSCSVVATDGHRLHVAGVEVDTELNQSCIIPASAIAPLHKFLDSGEVTVRISSNHIRISDEESSIQTTLIDGRYPNWKAVIPKANDGQLTYNVAELTNAVKGALITSNEKFKGIKMITANAATTIESNAPDGTSSEDVVECAMTYIDEITFGANGNYILDALSSINGSNVNIMVKDGNSAMLIKEDKYMAVVMPMKL